MDADPTPGDRRRDQAAASHGLDAALRSLAPRGVAVGSRRVAPADIARLHTSEAQVVRSARPERRAEFASGRVLLRELLDTDAAILTSTNGSPAMPTGSTGSLAHDTTWAIAATTRDTNVVALGIDIEPHTALTASESDLIVGVDDVVVDPLLAFVQKEAVYKAWSTLGGRVLDHHEVVIESDDGGFTATVVDDGSTFTGRHTAALGRHLALVVARNPGPDR